jgi:hypothetical protein
MRLLVAILLSAPLLAQETPAMPAEPWVSGSVEIGNRWMSDVGGSLAAYRSVVNLGSGPKLLGLDLSLAPAAHRLFDKATIRASNWGDDPYSTLRVDAKKDRLYDFSFDYRGITYFNALPSFADPTIAQGVLLNQRSFDIRRRMFDARLDLFPRGRIIPYLAYSRDSGSGTGVTDFQTTANEFAVANILRDKTDNYRGGARIEFSRFHATLEQGGTTFKDDQRAYFDDGTNFGNRTTTYLGQRLFLSDLNQAYGVRGDSIYSKALFTANPFAWVNLYGQFLYSRPETNANYDLAAAGKLVSPLSTVQFVTAQRSFLTSQAKQPHTSGSFGAELRLHQRLRVFESLMTDRFHTTSAVLDDSLVTKDARFVRVENGRLVYNYNRQEVTVMFDLTSRLTLRGGHRYVWGDAETRASDLSQTGPQEQGKLKMNVGLAGMTFKPVQKLSLSVDFEAASADQNYFRTSLQDYQKGRFRARYQVLNSLTLSANFSLLHNENPAAGINYKFLSRDNSLSALWTPRGGKRITLLADYTRSTLRSDITYLVPAGLFAARSIYRQNAHVATAVLDLNLPRISQEAPKLSAGGSFFISSGSRPTEYYQPLVQLTFPLHRRVRWMSEWRWYNLGEGFYLYEGFRAHQFVTALRLAL